MNNFQQPAGFDVASHQAGLKNHQSKIVSFHQKQIFIKQTIILCAIFLYSSFASYPCYRQRHNALVPPPTLYSKK